MAAWLIAGSCGNTQVNQQQEKIQTMAPEEITEFVVNEEIHNFGTLTAGEIVIFSFVLTNTGQNPLILKNLERDCECIRIRFNGKPVLPGEKGMIEVEWDTSGMTGKQYQPVAMEMNTKERKYTLGVVAEVQHKNMDRTYENLVTRVTLNNF